jgi:hypothetical protein
VNPKLSRVIYCSFIDHRQRSNVVTTAAGEQRVREFIESREIDMKHVTKRIEEEEARIILCDNAIYNLELAILDGRKILEAHNKKISTLRNLKEQISDIPSLLSWETKPEETSESLCNEFKACFVIPAAKDGKKIQDQIDLATDELRKLLDKIRQLEMDLEMWKFSRKLSQPALDHLKSAISTIEEGIKSAVAAFRPLWKIPTNVWGTIFDCVRREELDDYLKNGDLKALRPVVHVLSHVCYSWRRIVETEPSLWTTVYAPPTRAWKRHEYDLLVSSAQKSNQHITLLVNVNQNFTFPHQYDPSRRLEKDGSIAATLVPDERTIFHGNPYTLHVKIVHDHPSGMERMFYLPFRQASSVIVQSEKDIQYGSIFSYASYEAVNSLTIIGNSATFLPAITIVETIPHITNLNISIRKLPTNMAIAGYLPSALEELHIRHEVRATFPSLPTSIQLPNLRTLGLSYGSMGLLEVASMVELQTLILYGSSEHTEMHQIQPNGNADNNYRRVKTLEFREWGMVGSGSRYSGAVSLLQKLVSKMRAVHSIKFIDSSVNGEHLVTVVHDARKRKSNGGGSLKALKEVTLSRVSRITRSQCDRLANSVPKLNIYV